MQRLAAVSAVISGLSLLAWWWSFLLFPAYRDVFVGMKLTLPITESGFAQAYVETVATPLWVYVNLFEVVSILAALIATVSYFKVHVKDDSRAAPVMLVLLMAGYFTFSAIAFYETFLWPTLAREFPKSLDLVSGPIYTSRLWLLSMIVGILSYWIGHLWLGRHIYRSIHRTAGALVMSGVSILSLGYFIGGLFVLRYVIQSVGITVLAFGFIALGARLWTATPTSAAA